MPIKTFHHQSEAASPRGAIWLIFALMWGLLELNYLATLRKETQASLWRKGCRRLTAAVKTGGAEWNGSWGERGWRKRNTSSLFAMQSCGCARCWITHKPRQKASQEQGKEKERSAERRTSGQTAVTMMNGDFRAMTSRFSSRGHVLPHMKSGAVKITRTK